ncbi:MAG: nucleoside hydrolase [Aliidongia sp.]
MQRLIIDCDPGHDDAIAILYAAKHLDLRAITTVFGNASVAQTTRNALRICELAGLDIPVAAGFAGPLLGGFVSSPIHGETGLDGARHLPEPVRQPVSQHAVDRIIEEAGAAPGSIAVVAIGPLTNVAVALRKEPRLATWLHSISIMGGSTDIGNETPFAEANIFRDPEAADIVFRSGAALRMAGLNLTRQARIDRGVVARLRGLGGDVRTACAGILEFYPRPVRAAVSDARCSHARSVRDPAFHPP